jgi:hypothetical protein
MTAAPRLLPVVEIGEKWQRLEKLTFAIAVLKYCKVETERQHFKKTTVRCRPRRHPEHRIDVGSNLEVWVLALNAT